MIIRALSRLTRTRIVMEIHRQSQKSFPFPRNTFGSILVSFQQYICHVRLLEIPKSSNNRAPNRDFVILGNPRLYLGFRKTRNSNIRMQGETIVRINSRFVRFRSKSVHLLNKTMFRCNSCARIQVPYCKHFHTTSLYGVCLQFQRRINICPIC